MFKASSGWVAPWWMPPTVNGSEDERNVQFCCFLVVFFLRKLEKVSQTSRCVYGSRRDTEVIYLLLQSSSSLLGAPQTLRFFSPLGGPKENKKKSTSSLQRQQFFRSLQVKGRLVLSGTSCLLWDAFFKKYLYICHLSRPAGLMIQQKPAYLALCLQPPVLASC